MREKREGTFRTWSEDDSDGLSGGYRSAQVVLIKFPRGPQKQRSRLTEQSRRGGDRRRARPRDGRRERRGPVERSRRGELERAAARERKASGELAVGSRCFLVGVPAREALIGVYSPAEPGSEPQLVPSRMISHRQQSRAKKYGGPWKHTVACGVGCVPRTVGARLTAARS